jgi:hypothetical protein
LGVGRRFAGCCGPCRVVQCTERPYKSGGIIAKFVGLVGAATFSGHRETCLFPPGVADEQMWVMLQYLVLWAGLGLLGTVVMCVKNMTVPRRAVLTAVFTIPHAIVFDPIWLLIALVARSHRECPYCKSAIPAAASVCPECTRSLVE